MIALPPRTLLSHADVLMTEPPAALAGRWPSVVTVLLRQALERCLAQLWIAKEKALVDAPYRAQLLMLPRYIDRETAQQAAVTWFALSAACHQRAYDLPPTAVELARWYEGTEALVREVTRVLAASAAKKSTVT